MPELRIDPLTGVRAIVAGERAGRPGGGFSAAPEPPMDPESDPFLEGHEDRTPPELFAMRPNGGSPDGPGWSVRVVPNLYPALAAEEEGKERAVAAAAERARLGGDPHGAAGDPIASGRAMPELFTARPATGAHEVVVNAPGPVRALAELDPAQLETAMGVWRERIRARADAAYVHVSVNEGGEAGASLPHTHAQVYALPFVPPAVARERERFTAYAHRTQGRNLLEDLLQEEVRRGERIVAIDAEAVALCPFASTVPFQLQLVPRRSRERFEDEGPLAAALLHQVLRRLGAALGALPPLNLWVRTAPRGSERYCWRIDVLPRLTALAGLELGTGLHLNVLPPERAAVLLREAAAGASA